MRIANLKKNKQRLLRQLTLTGVVIVCRLLGWLQPLEWRSLDAFLRLRPAEAPDPYITLVFITEEDLRGRTSHPIPDADLAALIQTIQRYDPRVVGVDIIRDRAVGEGAAALRTALTASSNVVVIDYLGNGEETSVKPLEFLPDDQVGFSDTVVDGDGATRIGQLGEADGENCRSKECYRFSFALQIVKKYLAVDGYALEQGIRNQDAMRFGNAEIPHFQPNTGGYVRADSGGNQTLINFRSGENPFAQMTYSDILSDAMAENEKRALLQDRAVLITYGAASVKDFITSFAMQADNPSLIRGVFVQAHTASQILNAVYHRRAFIRTLPDVIEYGLIIFSGAVGICFAYRRLTPVFYWLLFALALAIVLLSGYPFLLAGWWLPVVPMSLAFGLSAVILFPLIQVQRQLQQQEADALRTIGDVYSAIHNGPLQEISGLLKEWPNQQPLPAQKRARLQRGNDELRGIYANLAEMLPSTENIVLSDGERISAELALHEMLRASYQRKKLQYQAFFSSIMQIIRFDEMADSALTKRDKQLVVRFFEEALTNVYKHAKDTTRLKVVCKTEEDKNIVQIIDNGSSPLPDSFAEWTMETGGAKGVDRGGFGTSNAKRIAAQLQGDFSLSPVNPYGTRCELSWPVVLPMRSRMFKKLFFFSRLVQPKHTAHK